MTNWSSPWGKWLKISLIAFSRRRTCITSIESSHINQNLAHANFHIDSLVGTFPISSNSIMYNNPINMNLAGQDLAANNFSYLSAKNVNLFRAKVDLTSIFGVLHLI